MQLNKTHCNRVPAYREIRNQGRAPIYQPFPQNDHTCPDIYEEPNTANDQQTISCRSYQYFKVCKEIVSKIMKTREDIYDPNGPVIILYDVANITDSGKDMINFNPIISNPLPPNEIRIYFFNETTFFNFINYRDNNNHYYKALDHELTNKNNDEKYFEMNGRYFVLQDNKCECDERPLLLMAYMFNVLFKVNRSKIHIFTNDDYGRAQHGPVATTDYANKKNELYPQPQIIYNLVLREMGLPHISIRNISTAGINRPKVFTQIADQQNTTAIIPTEFRLIIWDVLRTRHFKNYVCPTNDVFYFVPDNTINYSQDNTQTVIYINTIQQYIYRTNNISPHGVKINGMMDPGMIQPTFFNTYPGSTLQPVQLIGPSPVPQSGQLSAKRQKSEPEEGEIIAGGNEYFRQKYFKYKQKYLQLKNKINS